MCLHLVQSFVSVRSLDAWMQEIPFCMMQEYFTGVEDTIVRKKAKGDTSGYDKDRPVLVLRWDATLTPPPGAGIITTTATKYVGSMLYATLFGFESCNPCGSNSDDKE
eukprot:g14411.t1 g14411   contig9:1780315-1780638(+)